MLQKIPLISILLLMIFSWLFGLYSLSLFYTPTIVFPVLDNYYWFAPTAAMLGLTAIFTIVSVLIYFMLKKRQPRKFPAIHVFNALAWVLIIAIQVKIVFFNLGICH